MRILSKAFLGLAALAVTAVPVQAQQGRGRGFGGPGLGMVLSNKGVQEELKLDDAQVEKVNALVEKTRKEFASATEGLEGQERFEKMREVAPKIEEETRKAVHEILKPEQRRRLHQIHHQVQGAQAFADEHVQQRLKLTDAQKGEIHSILEESRGKMREIFQESQGDREAARAKITELRKETLGKVEAKLTDEQKAHWKEMLGAPYEFHFEGPGGR